MEKNPVQRVIKKMGSQAALATAVGVSYQAIQQWKKIPAPRVLEVERLTGISRYELRPDIYGAASDSRATQ